LGDVPGYAICFDPRDVTAEVTELQQQSVTGREFAMLDGFHQVHGNECATFLLSTDPSGHTFYPLRLPQPLNKLRRHHDMLLANVVAQTEALEFGKTAEQVKNEEIGRVRRMIDHVKPGCELEVDGESIRKPRGCPWTPEPTSSRQVRRFLESAKGLMHQ
jgi:glucose-6-phosphate isomerase